VHDLIERGVGVRSPSQTQGASLGAIATKTGIPKTSLHRYLTPGPTEATTDL
jgi:hypothetical protein